MPLSLPKTIRCAVVFALGVAIGRTAEELTEARIELLFRPQLGERLALSPDGRHLAYTRHVDAKLVLEIMDLERLERKARVTVAEDQAIPTSLKEKRRATLFFLEWANPNRLVFAPPPEMFAPTVTLDRDFLRSMQIEVPPPQPKVFAQIVAVDADGSHLADLLDIEKLQEVIGEGYANGAVFTPFPSILGFADDDRENLLIFNYGRVHEGIPARIRRLNIQTGKITELQEDLLAGVSRFRYGMDRTGHFRLVQFPDGINWRYEYRTTDPKQWWQKLPDLAEGGATARFNRTVDNYFGERAIPLGFGFDPDVLIYASNLGRDTFGIYGMNLTTRRRTPLAIEHPRRDLASVNADFPLAAQRSSILVFDRFKKALVGARVQGPEILTVWIDPDLATVQRTLDDKFPQRTVQILEWSEDRSVFTVLVRGGSEPGRVFLYQRAENLVTELMRRTPWLPNNELQPGRFFEFTTPAGAELTGHLTMPRRPRINPPPLIVWLAPGIPSTPHHDYDPQAQVLADLGFLVCRLNQRGTLGLGTRHREATGSDLVRATAEDAVAAIDWVARQQPIDRRRVVLLGEGFAGHTALRAAQLKPEAFRCVVVFDPVIDLRTWLSPAQPFESSQGPTFDQEVRRVFMEKAGLSAGKGSALAHADELTAPVFFAVRAMPRTPEEIETAQGAESLQSRLAKRGVATTLAKYSPGFTDNMPAARLRIYRELEEFLNLNLYNYNVKVGPTKEVK